MIRKVCVITLPPTRNASGRENESRAFPLQAKSIVQRNLNKEESLEPPEKFVFSSGAHGDTDSAFRSMARAGISNFRKVYVLAHGNETGIEDPKLKNGTTRQFKASELVEKFMTHGGMKAAVQEHVRSAIHSNGRASGSAFESHVRLLACRTGVVAAENGLYETKSADSYARDVLNLLARGVKEAIKEVAEKQPDGFGEANFRFSLTVTAPKGWSVVTTDGGTVVYHSASSNEQAADTALERTYRMNSTKQALLGHERTKSFMLGGRGTREDRIRLCATLEKYRNQPLSAKID